MNSSAAWPALRYEEWRETCDTVHAHTQVLGKLAAALASPEPELQHAAAAVRRRERSSRRHPSQASSSYGGSATAV